MASLHVLRGGKLELDLNKPTVIASRWASLEKKSYSKSTFMKWVRSWGSVRERASRACMRASRACMRTTCACRRACVWKTRILVAFKLNVTGWRRMTVTCLRNRLQLVCLIHIPQPPAICLLAHEPVTYSKRITVPDFFSFFSFSVPKCAGCLLNIVLSKLSLSLFCVREPRLCVHRWKLLPCTGTRDWEL